MGRPKGWTWFYCADTKEIMESTKFGIRTYKALNTRRYPKFQLTDRKVDKLPSTAYPTMAQGKQVVTISGYEESSIAPKEVLQTEWWAEQLLDEEWLEEFCDAIRSGNAAIVSDGSYKKEMNKGAGAMVLLS